MSAPERLNDSLQLLRRYEYLCLGATRVKNGFNDDTKPYGRCPCCGWPQEGHTGLGRYKGNAENTHEEGCSLYAVLNDLPAPRLAACNDSWRVGVGDEKETNQ